ncbi:hypothetical protein HPB50_006635 [Hyalomma asiaticum]|uniref:Uncharacterized protein n=1 Tax=Hyalomma asiaticum TaxID=266040 RepID=A0ACB7T5Z6_HYAAI|nr:hypothetical protein HPB50_006635 [Hyalomma asiaticum]
MPPEKSPLFTNAKKAITVDPIPRNIHPTHNEGRRKATAKAILDKIKHNEAKVLFIDTARYWNRGAYAVSVVDAHGSLVNAATVVTNFTHEAEEMAIAVALRSCMGASVIYSDSRTAIRTFSAALVSLKAATVVNKLFCQERGEENFPSSHIAWFPAHMGNISGPPDCNPNERAHQLAQELTSRVCGPPPRFNAAWRNLDNKDPLVSYHELASSHRLGRQIFPPPHTKLNRAQAITYRQLQTRTYITPTTLSRIIPDFPTLEQGNRKRRCRSERRVTALTHQQRRRSRKTAGKEQHQCSTKVSSARNGTAPPQHHDEARSLRNPPAWTSRLQPNLQAAARTCPPGQAKEEASPAGSEEPRPNEVMMQKTARDQGFANWLLQVATNNRSGGAYEGATRTTGLPAPAATYRSQVRPQRQQRQDQRQQRRQGLQRKRRRRWLQRLRRCRGLLATPTTEPTEVQEDMARDTSCLLLLKDDVRFTRRAVSVVGGPS